MDGQFSFLTGKIEEERHSKPSVGTRLVYLMDGREYPCQVEAHCGYDMFWVRFLGRQPSDDDPDIGACEGWHLSMRGYGESWRYVEETSTDQVTYEELDAKYNIPRDYQKKEGWTDDWHYTEIETPAENGIYYVIHEIRNSDYWNYTYMAWFHGYWWAYAGYGNKWLICNDKPREWMIPFAWVEVPDLYYRTDDSYQHLREIFPSEKDWEYEKRMMEIHEENKRWIRGGTHGDM